jgi:putative ABC transport system permease protein
MALLEAVHRESAHAVRSLVRAPSFSLIAILTLALGLGAATTIFTVLDRVVLRPLPYPHADRLVQLTTLWPKVKAGEEYALSKGQYFFFKKNSNVLQDIAMYDEEIAIVPGDGAHPAERVPMIDVSASTFSLLGMRAEKGRLFTADQELAPDGSPGVAVISHGYWQRRFGGDPNIIGKKLQLGDETLEIIGVLDPEASTPNAKADIWIRNHLDPTAAPQNNHTHQAIGLLKPNVTVDAARADLKRVQAQMQAEYPRIYAPEFLARSGFMVNVTSLRDFVLGPTIARALWLIFGAVAFVLLIASANVANLFLVRIESRRREVAVRTALGAARSHLAAYYLVESVLLSLVAAVGALAIGYALLRVVLAVAPQSLPRLETVHLDSLSVSFCVGLSLVFGIVFGLLPLTSGTADLSLLRDGGRGLTTSKSRDMARGGLVLAQVALAVLLLSGAGLMVKSFANLRSVRPGFDPTGVVTMTVILPQGTDRAPGQAAAFWKSFLTRVQALPGVRAAGAAGGLPLTGQSGCSSVVIDHPGPTGETDNCMPWVLVTPGYFEAMSIPVQGELPTWSTMEARTAPTVVAAAFAKRFWGDARAVGETIRPFNPKQPPFPVIGVAGDVRANGLQSPPIQAVYFPIVPASGTQYYGTPTGLSVVVKAPSLGSAAVAQSVRRVLAEVEPNALIEDIQPMETIVAHSTAQTSFTMLLLLLSAAIALALSAVGIYGVISYVVSQRHGEIGIRMALGAQMADVVRMVVGQSLKLAAIGAAIGLVAAIAGMRALQSMLFNVSASDPFILVGTAVALLLVGALASLGPARRAAKIDPVEAMRT